MSGGPVHDHAAPRARSPRATTAFTLRTNCQSHRHQGAAHRHRRQQELAPYGDANPTLTASFTGFKNGETLATSGVTGSPSLSTTAVATSPVSGSPYTITAALGTLAAGNYSFTFANGQLTVGKAPLTVTADNKSRAVR